MFLASDEHFDDGIMSAVVQIGIDVSVHPVIAGCTRTAILLDIKRRIGFNVELLGFFAVWNEVL